MVGKPLHEVVRKDFKKDLQVTRATFNLNLDVIAPYVFKEHYSYVRTTHLVHLPSSSSLCGCWLVLQKITLLYVVSVFTLEITCCVWLQKPNLCKENDYTTTLYFLCEQFFLPLSHWLHNAKPGTLCKHHTYVDSAWKRLLFIWIYDLYIKAPLF